MFQYQLIFFYGEGGRLRLILFIIFKCFLLPLKIYRFCPFCRLAGVLESETPHFGKFKNFFLNSNNTPRKCFGTPPPTPHIVTNFNITQTPKQKKVWIRANIGYRCTCLCLLYSLLNSDNVHKFTDESCRFKLWFCCFIIL